MLGGHLTPPTERRGNYSIIQVYIPSLRVHRFGKSNDQIIVDTDSCGIVSRREGGDSWVGYISGGEVPGGCVSNSSVAVAGRVVKSSGVYFYIVIGLA